MNQILARHQGEDVRQPLSRDALFRTVGLLVGLSLMGLLLASRPEGGGFEIRVALQAAILTAVTALAIVFVPWHRLPDSIRATPPLAFLVVAFLTRESTTGAESVYAQLVLLPVVWLAVYGSPKELVGGLLGVAVALITPMLIPGGEQADWRRTFVLIGTAAVLGFAIQIFFTQLRAHTGRLSEMGLTDHLTGVANRRAWDDDLERAIGESKRTRRPLSIAVLNVDHFKAFNDEHGHLAGDRFLKEVAALWRSQLRHSDVLARIGGDEYAVVFRTCTVQSALRVVIRFCHDLPSDLTCSAGVAQWDGHEAPFELMARADAALYRAKDMGRGRPVVAEPGQAPPRGGASAQPASPSR
jgi:diguanylate cyclase (GGDEF)-like protein